MANITDVDQFDATIEVPTSGQLASAADIRDKFVQKLANRTRNLKNRLDGVDTDISDANAAFDAKILVDSHFAMFTFNGAQTANTAFVLTESLDPSSGFSLTSNRIEVPAAGTYLVAASGAVLSTLTSNPLLISLDWHKNGSSFGLSASEVTGLYRYSATTTISVPFSSMFLTSITTPASERISLHNSSSFPCTSASGQITVMRLT